KQNGWRSGAQSGRRTVIALAAASDARTRPRTRRTNDYATARATGSGDWGETAGRAGTRERDATSDARTQDAIRDSIESPRVVTTIGILAPSTSPAASPRVMTVSVRSTINALSIPGAIITSRSPAISDAMPLACAASADSAVSGVNGPSM